MNSFDAFCAVASLLEKVVMVEIASNVHIPKFNNKSKPESETHQLILYSAFLE